MALLRMARNTVNRFGNDRENTLEVQNLGKDPVITACILLTKSASPKRQTHNPRFNLRANKESRMRQILNSHVRFEKRE
jgi:hypothetical protein